MDTTTLDAYILRVAGHIGNVVAFVEIYIYNRFASHDGLYLRMCASFLLTNFLLGVFRKCDGENIIYAYTFLY